MDKRKLPQTEEHKKKIGDAQRGEKNHAFGKIPWNKGKKMPEMSEQEKKNHSIAAKKYGFGKWMKYKTGEKHWNWKGGCDNRVRARFAPRPRPNECEVCGAMGKINLDHDHTKNKFRGWLCTRCNLALGLGMVKDNADTLIALGNYIKKFNNDI